MSYSGRMQKSHILSTFYAPRAVSYTHLTLPTTSRV